MSARVQAPFVWSRLPDLPEALGLGGAFAGTSQGCFLVAGGTNFPEAPLWQGGKKLWHDAVYLLAHPQTGWTKAGTLPRPLAYGISVTTNEGFLCIGGCDAQRHYTEVCRLRIHQGALDGRLLSPLPRSMAYGCGARLGDVIYIAGGLEMPDSTAPLRNFWALDLRASAPRWSELAPWPGPGRMLAVAAVQDGAFFLISGVALVPDTGGKIVRSYLRDAYRFSPGAGWTRLADIPRPIVAAPSPAASFGHSQILVLGADDGSTAGFQPLQAHPGFSKDMFVYDTRENSWTRVQRAPISCAAVPMVQWNQHFVIPSGELRPGVRSPQVWAVTPGN